MRIASLLLLVANVVYATSYVVTRVVLDDVPPTILALLRLVIAAAVLVPLSLRATVPPAGRMLLGERLTRREAGGAALAVAGAVVVVLNGVPGLTLEVLPRWRGDILLILSGVAYASYSLLGQHGATEQRV